MWFHASHYFTSFIFLSFTIILICPIMLLSQYLTAFNYMEISKSWKV